MANTLKSLASQGQIRAAINTGNKALVQMRGGEASGVSPALARRLASEIEAELQPVVYDGAGDVFADADRDIWDVAFLAIDAERAKKLVFTRPYLVIEATYAVRCDSDIRSVDDIDKPGRTVVLSSGSAYDMFLSGALQHTAIRRSATPEESFTDFKNGHGDAVAGVRDTLEHFFGEAREFRILESAFARVEQAMALPGKHAGLISELDEFVARTLADGFITRSVAASKS